MASLGGKESSFLSPSQRAFCVASSTESEVREFGMLVSNGIWHYPLQKSHLRIRTYT